MANFLQIDLDDWEPGPYVLLAGISPLPEELQRRCNIKFHEITEQLGLMDIAFIELQDGTRFILQRYRDSPGPGTQIWGIKGVSDISRSIKSLLICIGLDHSALFWVADK